MGCYARRVGELTTLTDKLWTAILTPSSFRQGRSTVLAIRLHIWTFVKLADGTFAADIRLLLSTLGWRLPEGAYCIF